jgi:hypothetical protein
MAISYTYSLGLLNSPTSPTVTLFCADKPSAPIMPLVTWKDINRLVLNWVPPGDNGSSILGYQLYMKLFTDPTYVVVYDGSSKPSNTFTTISTYLGNPLAITSYSFQLYAINIVGVSAASPVLTVQINDTASLQYSILSGAGLSSFPANTYVNIALQVNSLLI